MDDKQNKMLDSMGKMRTQSLFLELGYNDEACFTLKDIDYEYQGKIYPSLKRLYLEAADPTEYSFAKEYLLGWKHWQRMCDNKLIAKHIEEWRDELEVMLRSRAILDTLKEAKKGHIQAAKCIEDRGWATRGAGRPSKAEIEKQTRINERIENEYKDDVVRLFKSN